MSCQRAISDSYKKLCTMSKTSNKSNSSKQSHKGPKRIISADNVYKPVGPYSQAVAVDKTIYVSGVLGMDVGSNMMVGIEGQTRQMIENLKQILECGDSSLRGVVKATVVLTNMDDFPTFNRIYAEYFNMDCPARMSYQVSKLPLNALIEMDAIAVVGVKDVACPCSQQQQLLQHQIKQQQLLQEQKQNQQQLQQLQVQKPQEQL